MDVFKNKLEIDSRTKTNVFTVQELFDTDHSTFQKQTTTSTV